MGIFGNAFSGWHLLLILAVVVLLFGAAKLPALAKSVGQSVRILRSETAEVTGEPALSEAAARSDTSETDHSDGSTSTT
ncbi:twin-arginine translocase TatA/TatE family subunit [Microbacterium sp. NPDC090007]|uniref:Sec-independent protein translocase subunit TatA/TatB n=1 Tax=Microbacterium sp. NPDC090007 TaxID=3364204 RepID=UPI00382B6B2F